MGRSEQMLLLPGLPASADQPPQPCSWLTAVVFFGVWLALLLICLRWLLHLLEMPVGEVLAILAVVGALSTTGFGAWMWSAVRNEAAKRTAQAQEAVSRASLSDLRLPPGPLLLSPHLTCVGGARPGPGGCGDRAVAGGRGTGQCCLIAEWLSLSSLPPLKFAPALPFSPPATHRALSDSDPSLSTSMVNYPGARLMQLAN